MSELTINKIIIHELLKEQHHNIQANKYGETVLDVENEIVKKLISGIVGIYGRKNNGASYGSFKLGEETIIFPGKFKAYHQSEAPNNDDFILLTRSAMECLYEKASMQTASSGGYILFSDYATDQGRFFVIAMIKKQAGMKLSEDLVPEELIELDLRRIHQAARINHSKLEDYFRADDEQKKELNYLSFVSPKASQTTAGYFITALGCAAGAASAQATRNLITESVKFFAENALLKGKKKIFKEALISYLKDKETYNQTAKLSEIAGIARKHMPTDQEVAEPLVDSLYARLNSEEIAIPIEFSVNKPVVKNYTHFTFETSNWKFNFSKSALGEDENAQIMYDKENKKITIKELSREVITEIEKELADRQSGVQNDNTFNS